MSTAQRKRGTHLPSLNGARTSSGEAQAFKAELSRRIKRRKGRDAQQIALALMGQIARKHKR